MFLNALKLLLFHISVTELSQVLQCGIKAFSARRDYFASRGDFCYNLTGFPGNVVISSPMAFEKLSTNNITLLRIMAGSGTVAYTYYTSYGDYNNSIIDYRNGPTQNFKSKLLREWSSLRPSFMNMTLRDINNQVVAWLAFRVKSTDDTQTWFTLDNLYGVFPWIMKNVTSRKFDIFSLKGRHNKINWRTFLIRSNVDASCKGNFGMLCIYEKRDRCEYVTQKTYPAITYYEKDQAPAPFSSSIRFADSLEVTGIYHRDVEIFIRI